MLVLCGVVVGILAIYAACASVKRPLKVYSTCKIILVHRQSDTERTLWVADCEDRNSQPFVVTFHQEVKAGWTVEYAPFMENADPTTHAYIHTIFSTDTERDAP
jgi:vancomycin permeability regulator SanA